MSEEDLDNFGTAPVPHIPLPHTYNPNPEPKVPKKEILIALLQNHIKHLERTKMNGKAGLLEESRDILKIVEGK